MFPPSGSLCGGPPALFAGAFYLSAVIGVRYRMGDPPQRHIDTQRSAYYSRSVFSFQANRNRCDRPGGLCPERGIWFSVLPAPRGLVAVAVAGKVQPFSRLRLVPLHGNCCFQCPCSAVRAWNGPGLLPACARPGNSRRSDACGHGPRGLGLRQGLRKQKCGSRTFAEPALVPVILPLCNPPSRQPCFPVLTASPALNASSGVLP